MEDRVEAAYLGDGKLPDLDQLSAELQELLTKVGVAIGEAETGDVYRAMLTPVGVLMVGPAKDQEAGAVQPREALEREPDGVRWRIPKGHTV